MHVDAVIELADLDRRAAGNLEPWRTGTEAMALLAPGEQLAKIEVVVELEAHEVLASPDHARRNCFRRQFDADKLANGGRSADEGHQAACRKIFDADKLLHPGRGRELADAKHRRDAFVAAALGRTRHRSRQRNRRRLEGRVACAGVLIGGFPADQRAKHRSASPGRIHEIAPKWDFMDTRVKLAFLPLTHRGLRRTSPPREERE